MRAASSPYQQMSPPPPRNPTWHLTLAHSALILDRADTTSCLLNSV